MDVQDFITYTMAAGNITGTILLFRSWKSTQIKDRALATIEENNAAKLTAEIYAQLTLDIAKPMQDMRDEIGTLKTQVEEYKRKCSFCEKNKPHETTIIQLPNAVISSGL